MYISWKIWCTEEASAKMIDRVSRIMQYENVSPYAAFRGSLWWKYPQVKRNGGAYQADRLPEDLYQRISELDPLATVNVVEQGTFLEYTLSTSVKDIISNPERVFVACSIYKNL